MLFIYTIPSTPVCRARAGQAGVLELSSGVKTLTQFTDRSLRQITSYNVVFGLFLQNAIIQTRIIKKYFLPDLSKCVYKGGQHGHKEVGENELSNG